MTEYSPQAWTWWQKALRMRKEGRAKDIGSAELPIPEEPMTGFFRFRTGRGGPFLPVQFWYRADGTLLCDRNGKGNRVEGVSARGTWGFASSHPITDTEYEDFLNSRTADNPKGTWFDEVTAKVGGETESSQVAAPKADKPKRQQKRKPPEAAQPETVAQPMIEEKAAQIEAAQPAVEDDDDDMDFGSDDEPVVQSEPEPAGPRFFYHPESESLFELTDPTAIEEMFAGMGEGSLCEEIDEKRYRELEREADKAFARKAAAPKTTVAPPAEATIGHNLDPQEAEEAEEDTEEPRVTPFQLWTRRLNAWKAEVETLLKTKVDSKEVGDKYADTKAKLVELWQEGEALRVAEKRPHDNAANEVQARYKPLLQEADRLKANILRPLEVWLSAEQRRLNEEAAAENKRRADEAAAAAAAASDDDEMPFGDDAPPAQALPEVKARKAQVGTRRAVSAVKRKVPVITDVEKAAAHLAAMKPPVKEFTDIILKLGDRLMKAGVKVPGMEQRDEESAR